MVVLSLSSVPEETGSQVYDKNMHTLPGMFRPNILSSNHSLFFLI